jgi:hypothetical protein
MLAARFAAARGEDPDHVVVGYWDDKTLWRIGSPVG